MKQMGKGRKLLQTGELCSKGAERALLSKPDMVVPVTTTGQI